jgi:opacity protein-like surface antigen
MTAISATTTGIHGKQGVSPAFFLAGLLLALLALPLTVSAAESTAVSQEVDIGVGYAGHGATDLSPGSELNTNLKYVASRQVTKNLLVRLGAEWQRLSFPEPRDTVAPSTLQQANAIVGFDYQLAEQWLMRAELQPGIYGDSSQIDGRRFDVPLILGFVYLIDTDLQWFLGLRVDLKSHYPVFPAVGVRWQFADLWTLNLLLPNPRLEYDVNSRLQAYIGSGIVAGTYVVGDHFGDGRGLRQLNHAKLDYTELRIGPGLSWKARPNLTMEAEVGYVVYRKWDFFEEHIKSTSHPMPYLQLACRVRF